MPVVEVGATAIPYEIRRSPKARRMRITVRPDRVEVVAPRFTRRSSIRSFVAAKRDWIHAKTRALAEREVLAAPERFVSGATVQFRGRRLKLDVREGDETSLRFRNAFLVSVDRRLSDTEREAAARKLVMGWLRERARVDAEAWVAEFGSRLDVRPTRIRIGNQKTLWGSCSARGVVSLNWRLIGAPRRVFRYVVVHELCHLVERNHGPRFWALVEELLPGYREPRAWLKRRGIGLS